MGTSHATDARGGSTRVTATATAANEGGGAGACLDEADVVALADRPVVVGKLHLVGVILGPGGLQFAFVPPRVRNFRRRVRGPPAR